MNAVLPNNVVKITQASCDTIPQGKLSLIVAALLGIASKHCIHESQAILTHAETKHGRPNTQPMINPPACTGAICVSTQTQERIQCSTQTVATS
jgi:hypothetical protein